VRREVTEKLGAYAVAYATRGWSVFPCRPRGKEPATVNGFHEATDDVKTILGWWRATPDANIGLVPGRAGLLVLDLDGPEGDEAAGRLGLLSEPAVEVVTGRGRHRYYLRPDVNDQIGNNRLAPHLDVRCDAGYVLAPPSVHPSGAVYRWEGAVKGIGPLPPTFVELLLRAPGRNGEDVAARSPAVGDTIPEGERDATLTSLAGTMRRRGMHRDEILAALREVNGRRCLPPLQDDQVRKIATSVVRYAPAAERAVEDQRTLHREDFFAYMPMHSYLFRPTREHWPAASVNARVPAIEVPDADGKTTRVAAATWLAKHRPVEQMTWAPGEPEVIADRVLDKGGWVERPGVSCYNLYRPPTVEHGDPAEAEPWIRHVRSVYPDEADHLIKWLAHRVQRPGEKVNHGVVLGGAQGIGKDTILLPVKYAVGPWNFAEVTPAVLLGRFNDWVMSVVLRVNEARDLGGDSDALRGRYGFYEHLKLYTAAPPETLLCDRKHIRAFAVPNLCGVVLTTNHIDGVYLPADDRRFFVAWSELTKDHLQEPYWRALYAWYHAGGIEHVAAYLATLDLSTFDGKAPPPQTNGWHLMVATGQAPENGELADALDVLGNPEATTLAEISRKCSGEFNDFLRDRRNARRIPHLLEEVGYIAVRNSGAKDGKWKLDGRRQVIYARRDLTLRDRIAAAQALVGWLVR
jgi:hypothetical protein